MVASISPYNNQSLTIVWGYTINQCLEPMLFNLQWSTNVHLLLVAFPFFMLRFPISVIKLLSQFVMCRIPYIYIYIWIKSPSHHWSTWFSPWTLLILLDSAAKVKACHARALALQGCREPIAGGQTGFLHEHSAFLQLPVFGKIHLYLGIRIWTEIIIWEIIQM